uniref:KIF-binding protein n=1 Tax=Globisporangium ultimum (strain ATCC 200006 / CBS 805.95 / DAOM BR144) TaxID=431595 RepID=K3WQQ2_GLOUD
MPEDFAAILQFVDDVAAEPSPETAPYALHYRVLEILQKLLSTPISPLEAAVANAKIGATFLHVEEPHKLRDDNEKPWAKYDVDELLQSMDLENTHLLNQLGILWSNRTHPARALCYFQACEEFCASVQPTAHANDNSKDRFLEVRTHATFYLAQVYMSLQLSDESAQYCLTTLELQLGALLSKRAAGAGNDGDDIVDGVHEWVKNCLRLAKYYLGVEHLKDAATCLFACEYLLHTVHHLQDTAGDKSEDGNEKLRVQHAEICLSWAKVHQLVLKSAQFRDEESSLAEEEADAGSATQSLERTRLALCKERDNNENPTSLSPSGMEYVPIDTISTFEAARTVFKLGMRACETAKQVFVLNGFVTQHVRVSQLESQLYKRLVHFESDRKRQIAMELRRLNLLTALLAEELNPDAYAALLQELNYECAEIAASIFDLKQDKNGGADDKTNVYALKAIHFYQQYLLLFYPAPDAGNKSQRTLPSGKAAVRLPPSAMTPSEFRSVLLGYFGLARVCGRVQFPSDKQKTVLFWKQSLEYHESVIELVHKYEEQSAKQTRPMDGDGETLRQLFDAELHICREMAELLPEKINQLVYNGKVL